jgi:hypothetical protein
VTHFVDRFVRWMKSTLLPMDAVLKLCIKTSKNITIARAINSINLFLIKLYIGTKQYITKFSEFHDLYFKVTGLNLLFYKELSLTKP